MDAEFTGIKRTTTADLVCDQIKSNIVMGRWSVGDRIPSENELSKLFGVNRLTVRMALQKLNALGVLETRLGSGTYVIEFNFDHFIDEISDFYMEPQLLDDIFEFRLMLEKECARLAIERHTPEELHQLEHLVQVYQMQQKISYEQDTLDAYKTLALKDIDIHQWLCKMSHNKFHMYSFSITRESLYQYILILVKKRMEKWIGQRYPLHQIMDMDLHVQLVEAIRERNVQKSDEILTAMIDRHVEL